MVRGVIDSVSPLTTGVSRSYSERRLISLVHQKETISEDEMHVLRHLLEF